MTLDNLTFDFTHFYSSRKRLSKRVGIDNVTIYLPFISVAFSANNKEKKIVKEIILRLRDKMSKHTDKKERRAFNNKLYGNIKIKLKVE